MSYNEIPDDLLARFKQASRDFVAARESFERAEYDCAAVVCQCVLERFDLRFGEEVEFTYRRRKTRGILKQIDVELGSSFKGESIDDQWCCWYYVVLVPYKDPDKGFYELHLCRGDYTPTSVRNLN